MIVPREIFCLAENFCTPNIKPTTGEQPKLKFPSIHFQDIEGGKTIAVMSNGKLGLTATFERHAPIGQDITKAPLEKFIIPREIALAIAAFEYDLEDAMRSDIELMRNPAGSAFVVDKKNGFNCKIKEGVDSPPPIITLMAGRIDGVAKVGNLSGESLEIFRKVYELIEDWEDFGIELTAIKTATVKECPAVITRFAGLSSSKVGIEIRACVLAPLK